MLRLSSTTILPLTALMLTLGCPTAPPIEGEGEGEEGEGEEGEGEEGEGEQPGDGCFPAIEGNTVCDVQDSSSENHVAEGGIANLLGVIASSNTFVITRDDNNNPERFGVYVTDAIVEARSGVLVTYLPTTEAPQDIQIGDVLNVEGTVSEFSLDAPNSETRVDALSIVNDGVTAPPTPFVLEDPSDLASEIDGEDFEGVLVQINNVTTEEVGDFGQFTLTGGVVTDDTLFRYTSVDGEVFTSFVGVVSYNIFQDGGFKLLPRRAEDVVSEERPTNSVTDLNDNTVTRCAFNDAASCPAIVGDAVVVSPIIFDPDNNNENFDRFIFWVADGNNKDGAGRLNPQSGVMVTVLANNLPSSLTYTFEQDDDFNFLPGTAPEIGDVVEMAGRNTEDFGQGEFEALEIQKRSTVVDSPELAVLPALFTPGGARDTTELKGGRPDAPDGNFPGLENVTPSATIEQWQGVLVELQNVETIEACYAQIFDPNRNNNGDAFARDFGNFLVTGDVEIGDVFRLDQSFGGFFDSTLVPDNTDKVCTNVAQKCEDSREDGQTFTSLVGIVDFSFNVHRVNPRTAADISVDTGFVAAGTPDANCP